MPLIIWQAYALADGGQDPSGGGDAFAQDAIRTLLTEVLDLCCLRGFAYLQLICRGSGGKQPRFCHGCTRRVQGKDGSSSFPSDFFNFDHETKHAT